MLMTVPPSPAVCYPVPTLTTAENPQMIFNGALDTSGIKTALCVEEAGGWGQYDPATHLPPPEATVNALLGELQNLAHPTAMPPDPRYLRLLVDATAALHGYANRGAGWRLLGQTPTRGRRLLGADSARVTWELFHLALSFGLGYSEFTEPETAFISSDAD